MFRDPIRTLAVLLFLSVCARSSVFGAEHEGWLVDLEKAKAAAAEQKKDILMEFTGSDWCPPCIKLRKEVLDTEIFKAEAPKDFVLLLLDSPQDKSQQSEEEIKQVAELNERFQITGVPTILLADEQARPFAMMGGYDSTMTAEDYVKELAEKRKDRVARDKLFADADKAAGVEKAKLLDKAITMVSTDLALTYEDVVDQILKLDAQGKAGLKSKYEELRLQVKLKTEFQQIQTGFDPKKPDDTLEQIDALIAKYKLTGEAKQGPLMAKASITFQVKKDREAAKKLLLEAQELAPESNLGQQIGEIIKQLFSDEKDADADKDPPTEPEKK